MSKASDNMLMELDAMDSRGTSQQRRFGQTKIDDDTNFKRVRVNPNMSAFDIASAVKKKRPTSSIRITVPYERGTPEGLKKYGVSMAKATPEQAMNRTAAGFTGMGAYRSKRRRGRMSKRKRLPRGGYWGDRFGRMVGSLVGAGDQGAAFGDKAGDWLQSKLPSWIGGGAYRGRGAYVGNSLINPIDGDTNVVRMQSSMDETGALTVVHREYVTDVQSNSSFINIPQLVNPTNTNLFPFLSQFACNFEEYEFMQLVFEYRTVTTDNAVNTNQLGSIIMVCNSNAAAAPFVNKVNMMQYEGSQSCPVYHNMMFGVECDPRKTNDTTLYVPPYGQTPVGEDPKSYHLGLFQYAINQASATGQIGELWANYTVVLRKPKFCVAIGNNLPFLSARFLSTSTTNVLGFADNTSTRLVSSTNGSIAPSVSCNLNGAAIQVIASATYFAARAIKSLTLGGLNEWWLWQSASTAFYLVLPDNLAQGCFNVSATSSGNFANAQLLSGINGANLTSLSNNQIFDSLGSTPVTSSSFVVQSSCVNAGIAGTLGTGAYISFTYVNNGGTCTTLLSIKSINQGVGSFF